MRHHILHFRMHFLMGEPPLLCRIHHGLCHGMGKMFLQARRNPQTFFLRIISKRKYRFHSRLRLCERPRLIKDHRVRFRDRFLPLIDVALIMGFSETPIDPTGGVAVVVETEGGQQAALLFDAIQGQRQVVIKSLETNYQQVEGVAAATILGDGRVALILDVDVLVTDMRRKSVRPDFKLAS